MTKRRTAAVAIAAAALVATSACGDKDDPKTDDPLASTSPTTSTSSTPSPEYSAPPWPTLTKDETAAVKRAIRDGERAWSTLGDLQRDPKAAVANKGKKLLALKQGFYSPALNQQSRGVELLNREGLRIEGGDTTRWEVPTQVDLDADKPVIQTQRCATFEKVRLIGGKRADLKPTIYTTTYNPAFKRGTSQITGWRISQIKETGSC